MNKNLHRLLLFIAFLQFSQNALAQGGQATDMLKRAERDYNALKYAYAIPLLEQVLKAEPNHERATALIADSYRRLKNYQQAAAWYAKLATFQAMKPEWALGYAEVLASNMDYDGAEVWYKRYQQLASTDGRGAAFAKAYPNVQPFLQNKKRWQVDFTDINTPQSDYAPLYFNGGLLFVSNRKQEQLTKHIFAWEQMPFSDLYVIDDVRKIAKVNVDSVLKRARTDAALLKKTYRVNNDDTSPTSNDSRTFSYARAALNDTLTLALDANKNVKRLNNGINSSYHEGPAALVTKDLLMFTRNNYYRGKARKSSDRIIKLKMYTAKLPDMSDIKPFMYNNDEYSVGHPAIDSLGTLLIFVSDMPGGFGGTDLYYCTRNSIDDEWSKPVNMGREVNTEGNEMFPTLYQSKSSTRPSTTLFFSSTGHVGLGGLDIFQVALDGTRVNSLPINIGGPINSSGDDFSLAVGPDGYEGFLTSNRRGNDDIYAFGSRAKKDNYKISLQGTVADRQTGRPLPNVNIQLSSVTEGEKAHGTDEMGKYAVGLPKSDVIRINLSLEGYRPKSISISTEDIYGDSVIVKNFVLEALVDQVAVKKIDSGTCDSLKRLMQNFVLYYNLDRYNIRKDAQMVANNLADFLTANPEFGVSAASYCDSRGSFKYNLKLSQRRSQSARQYLIKKGVNASQIEISFHGEENLVNRCRDGVRCSEAEQQLNRRTEFILTYQGRNALSLDCEELRKIKK